MTNRFHFSFVIDTLSLNTYPSWLDTDAFVTVSIYFRQQLTIVFLKIFCREMSVPD